VGQQSEKTNPYVENEGTAYSVYTGGFIDQRQLGLEGRYQLRLLLDGICSSARQTSLVQSFAATQKSGNEPKATGSVRVPAMLERSSGAENSWIASSYSSIALMYHSSASCAPWFSKKEKKKKNYEKKGRVRTSG
jgi:hypothetical protein